MYPEYYPSFSLDYSSIDNTTLAGERAYLLEGRYDDAKLEIQKVKEVGTIIGNKGYFVQYIASPSIYSHYVPIVETMLDSVQIIPSSAEVSGTQPQPTGEQESTFQQE